MQWIASKPGAGEWLIPDGFRRQYHARGFRVREAPDDLSSVSEPTVYPLPAKAPAPLASVVSPVVEVSPAPTTGTLPKRRR